MNPLLAVRQLLFRAVHGNSLIYNTCWEDPRLDRVALNLNGDDVVLVITSAGCNALDYALEEPKHVHAVDLNPRQNALLELKLAGIRTMEFEDFFQLFGRGKLEGFGELYRAMLRPKLSVDSRKFWDRNQSMLDGSNRRESFYFHGTTGFFAWLMNQYVDRIARIRHAFTDAFSAKSVEEQRAIYESEIHDALFGKSVNWVVRRDTTMSLLGVPRPQRDQIDRDYQGGIAQFIQDCVRYVFSALPLHDNYFWRVYLTGSYSPECCPEYLKPDNFERLKDGLVDRVSIHTNSVAGLLEQEPIQPTKFILLDHQDWLSSFAIDELQREWNAIMGRATPNARVLWRSAGMKTDFIDRLKVDVNGRTRELGQVLRYDRDLAADLHTKDRVHTYGSFHIADLAMA